MRKMRVVVAGLLCFVAQGAHAQSFEQQMQEISQKASGAALQTRQAMAASQAAVVLDAADALDEAKVGVAAKFVSIKPSEFEMGSPKDEEGRYADEIKHPVKLTKGYEMQATAVTQLQYFMVMGLNPSTFRKQENCDADNFKVVHGRGLCVNHPVEYVSWDEAQAFIARLNKTQSKHTYRLPTEAEWENAARAGMPSSLPYSFGFDDELDNITPLLRPLLTSRSALQRRPFRREARPPQVRVVTFTASPPELRRRLLVARASWLKAHSLWTKTPSSGFCSSARGFAIRFFQRGPRGPGLTASPCGFARGSCNQAPQRTYTS